MTEPESAEYVLGGSAARPAAHSDWHKHPQSTTANAHAAPKDRMCPEPVLPQPANATMSSDSLCKRVRDRPEEGCKFGCTRSVRRCHFHFDPRRRPCKKGLWCRFSHLAPLPEPAPVLHSMRASSSAVASADASRSRSRPRTPIPDPPDLSVFNIFDWRRTTMRQLSALREALVLEAPDEAEKNKIEASYWRLRKFYMPTEDPDLD